MNVHFIFRSLIATAIVLGSADSLLAQSSPRAFAEVHVIRSMRQLHSAQMTFQATQGAGNFGSLAALRQAGLIDEALSIGEKYGYVYVVTIVAAVPGKSPSRFTATATPRSYRKTGVRSFFIDTGGDIRGADKNGQPATASDPVIDDCTSGSTQENERCTIADMRMLHGAQMTYSATAGNGNFALFPALCQAGLIRSDLCDSQTRGYLYETLVIDLVPNTQSASFKIWATPASYPISAIRSFYIDQTGVLRGADRNGGRADQNDPPINE